MRLLPRIALAVLLPLAVGMSVMAWTALDGARRAATEAEATAQRRVDARAAALAANVAARLGELRMLARTPMLRDAGGPAIRQALLAWREASGHFAGMGYIDLASGLLTPTEGPSLSLEGRPYLEMLRAGQDAAAQTLVSRTNGQPVVLHAVVVPGPDGRPLAGVGGILHLTDQLAAATRPPSSGLGPAPEFLLLDGQGRRLGGSLDGPLPPLATPPATARATLAAMAALAGLAPTATPTDDAGGPSPPATVEAPHLAPRLAFGTAVVGTDWRLWTLYERQAWDQAHGADLRDSVGLLAATVLAVGLLIGVSLHRLVLRPVASLDDALRRFGSGESEVRVPSSSSADELQRLAQRFNAMADATTASERRLRLIFEAMPHPVVLSEMDGGRFVDVNPAYERHLGLAREQIVGHTLAELAPGVDLEIQRRLDARLLATGRLDNIVAEYAGRDGQPRWSMLSSRLTEVDGRRMALTVSTDITALKQAEAELRRSQAAFNALFELAPLPLSYSDDSSGFTQGHFNQAWYRAFGYTPEQADGRSGTDFGLWQDNADRGRYAQRLLDEGAVERFEARLRHADGSPLTVWMSGRMIELAGRRLRVSAFLDVTEQLRGERRLRRYQAMVAGANDAMILLDEGRIVECNAATAAIYGAPREQLLGRSPADFSPVMQPDGRSSEQAAQQLIVAALAGAPQRFEWLHQRPDGGQRLVEVALSRLVENQRPLVVAAVRDITQRRADEQALRESGELLSRTFDLLPEPLALIRSADGRFVDVNRMWEHKSGYSRAQAVGRTGLELGLFDDPADLRRLSAAFMAQPEFDALPVTYHTADGRRLPCEVSARQMVYRGEAIGIWLIRDMSERLAAEQRYRQLNEGMMEGFAAVDQQGRVVQTNSAFRALVGYDQEQLQHLSFYELTPERWHDMERRILREQVDVRGYSELYEKEYRRADGSLLPVELRAHLDRDAQGQPCGYWAVARDITQRKQAEDQLRRLNLTLEERVQQRTAELAARNHELAQAIETLHRTRDELVRSEKLASLGALVAGVAHELNTPVGNAVMVASTIADRQRELDAALAQGLRRATLDEYLEVTREGLLVLERNLARAAELIGSFKQLAADQSSEQRRSFTPDELLHGVLLALSPRLRRAGVQVEQRLAPGLQLDSYPGPLGQVLENLLLNAIVHGFDGRDHGRILITAEADGDERLRLVVEDDGCGMAPEVLRHVFDPFFTTRLGSGGSGLGLHIVYTLVSGVLGGRIDVSSVPGQGSRFVLSLPRVAPARSA
ncbi:MAG: PAS domain S-box protein [Burkholderiaceae bacterium]|nr:PAS domain S-box protein [Burkholderiaceae bacterium]